MLSCHIRRLYYDTFAGNYNSECNDKLINIWGQEFLANETQDIMSINDLESLTVYDFTQYEKTPDLSAGEELLLLFLLDGFTSYGAAEYLLTEIRYLDELADEDYSTDMTIHYSVEDMEEAMRLANELNDNDYTIEDVIPEEETLEDGTHSEYASQYTVEIPDDMVFMDEDSPVPSNVYVEWYKYLKTLIEYKDKIPDNPDQAWYDEHMNKFNGWRFYQSITSVLGDQEKASLWLSENGIDGMTYEGGRDGGCFVIYNCDKLKIVGEY